MADKSSGMLTNLFHLIKTEKQTNRQQTKTVKHLAINSHDTHRVQGSGDSLYFT